MPIMSRVCALFEEYLMISVVKLGEMWGRSSALKNIRLAELNNFQLARHSPLLMVQASVTDSPVTFTLPFPCQHLPSYSGRFISPLCIY